MPEHRIRDSESLELKTTEGHLSAKSSDEKCSCSSLCETSRRFDKDSQVSSVAFYRESRDMVEKIHNIQIYWCQFGRSEVL